VVIEQAYFFGRIYQEGRRAMRANVESQIAVRLAEYVRAEKRSAFGIVKVTEHRGVNILDILAGIHRLGKAARRFSVTAHPVAKIAERVFQSRVGGALLARGFDRLPGLVSEIKHQTVERLDYSVFSGEQLEVSLFYVDKGSQREFAVTGEDADGHLAEDGREKTDATAAKRDRADVAFQREIRHLIGLGEIAVTKRAIVRIDVRRD